MTPNLTRNGNLFQYNIVSTEQAACEASGLTIIYIYIIYMCIYLHIMEYILISCKIRRHLIEFSIYFSVHNCSIFVRVESLMCMGCVTRSGKSMY